MKAQKQE